jgi:hypothetical protein
MTDLEETMTRSSQTRSRRRLFRAVVLGFAAAALAPASALASYVVDRPDGGIDRYLVAPAPAGLDAVGRALAASPPPAADLDAVGRWTAATQATRGTVIPSQTVTATGASVSTTDWSRIAIFSAVGLTALLGVFLVALTTRRGPRAAHS